MEDDDAPISRGRSRSNRVEITEDNDNIDPDGPPLPVLHENSSSSGSNIIDSNSENFNTTTGDTTTTINNNNNNNQEEDGPPMYDPTLLSFDSPPDDSNAGDDDDESDNSEEEDDDDDEPLPRTRARSKSVFDPYGALENEKGVVLINPSVIEEIASKAAAGAVTPTASGATESQLLKQQQQQSLERKGPLQMREVEALRKVSSNII